MKLHAAIKQINSNPNQFSLHSGISLVTMFVRLRHSLHDHDHHHHHQNRVEHLRGRVGACWEWRRHYNCLFSRVGFIYLNSFAPFSLWQVSRMENAGTVHVFVMHTKGKDIQFSKLRSPIYSKVQKIANVKLFPWAGYFQASAQKFI